MKAAANLLLSTPTAATGLIYLEKQSVLVGNLQQLRSDTINSDDFMEDEVHVVEDGENLQDIAEENEFTV